MASMASMKSMRPGAAAPPFPPSTISEEEKRGDVDGEDETGKEIRMSQFKSIKPGNLQEDGKLEGEDEEGEGDEDKEDMEKKLAGEEGNLTPSGSRRMSQHNLPLHVIDGEVVSVPAIIKHKIQDKIGLDNNGLAYVMKIRNLFDDLDSKDLGYLGWQQLRKGFASFLDIHLTMEETRDFFEKYDVQSLQIIQYREFEEMIREMVPPAEVDAGDLKLEYRLRKFFQENDLDDNGLSKEEIQEGLESMGMDITSHQLDRIFEIADTNGDGVLDFKEFASLYLRHKASDDYADKELEEADARWRPNEILVKDGHPWTRPLQKIMIRQDLRSTRGFQRLRGIGHLIRPEPVYGGRWYVKFPCSPEVLVSTGRRGQYEIVFYLDLLNQEMNQADQEAHELIWAKDDSRFLQEAKQLGTMHKHRRATIITSHGEEEYSFSDDEAGEGEEEDYAETASVSSVESFDADMKEYRYRLILARLQADPNAPVPKKKGEGNDGNLVPKKKA